MAVYRSSTFANPQEVGGTTTTTHGPWQPGRREFEEGLLNQRLPLLYQQSRFNTLLPILQQGMGQFSSMVGGGGGPGPRIDTGGVWNPQQVQQQVNASRATTDQTAAARNRQTQASLGGRGFGTRSPLLAALQGQTQNQAMATNAASERQIRWDASQGNAQHRLAGQTAAEDQFASRQREDIERRRTALGSWNALLASIAGLA